MPTEKITTDSRTNEVIIPITLEQDSRVSIALYSQDNHFITQLLAGELRAKGRSFIRWDKRDFLGNVIPDGSYIVRRIYHEIGANILAGAGNSSDNLITNIHIGYNLPIDICIAGNYLYYTNQYYELRPKQYRALLTSPNVCEVAVDVFQTTQNSYRCCSDGESVYWLGYANFNGANYYFTYRTKISDKTRYAFSSGSSQYFDEGGNYSCLAFNGGSLANNQVPNDISQVVKDCAVQPKVSGPYYHFTLLVNDTLIVHNTNGVIAQASITLPANTRRIECDAAGNLWLLTKSGVKKYVVNGDGSLTAATYSVSGVIDASGIAIAPDGSYILVADTGTSQHRKFSATNGNLLATIGTAGGYTGPAVTPDKIAVDGQSALAIQPDGNYWMIEQFNSRVVKYNVAGVAVDDIMYLPHTRDVAIDQNDPTKVFAGLLEFKIDYSLPMQHGNGSWKLVNNWQVGNARWLALKDVITFQAGTYATISARDNEYYNLFVKLDAATGIVDLGNQQILNENTFKPEGIYSATREIDPGNTIHTYLTPLTFSNGQPVFGTKYSIDSFVKLNTDPFYSGRPESSSFGEIVDGLLITFDSNAGKQTYESQGFHLGARNLATHTWQWRTAWQTGREYTGPFPEDERYDTGNDVKNPGSQVRGRSNLIYLGYLGEFWKGGQTNEYKIYHKNGMFLYGFGNNYDKIAHGSSINGMAGNALKFAIASVGGNDYLWHPDEGWLSRLHCWKITGLDTLKSSDLPLVLSSTALKQASPNQIDLMEGFTIGKVQTLANSTLTGWSRLPAADSLTTSPAAYWLVKTGANDLNRKGITAMLLSPAATHNYVQRTIGVNGLKSWRLSFTFAPLANPSRINADPPGSQAAVVLKDSTGKIIFLLDYRTPVPFSELKYEIAINNARLVKWDQKVAQIRDAKSVEVIYVNGKLKVYMDGYAPVVCDPLEAGVNPQNLGSLLLDFLQKNDYAQDYGIEIGELMLYTNSDEIQQQNYGLGSTENNTADLLNLVSLNTAYPGAPTDYQVYCPNINIIYQKKSDTLWVSLPYGIVS